MRRHFGLMSVALTLAGCSWQSPPESPVEIAAGQVRESIRWSADLDGRRVSIAGYIDFDNGPTGAGIAPAPRLTSRPFGAGDELIMFFVEEGKGANQLDLPVLKSTNIDWVPGGFEVRAIDMTHASFQDSAGVAHPFSTKVRVTGRLVYHHVRKFVVSEADPRSPTGRRFNPRLTDVGLEAVPVG